MRDRMECYKKLGRNLRKLRLQRDLMQIDLAVASNLDRTFISKIENGRARVTTNIIVKLIRGLQISSENLLDREANWNKDVDYVFEGGE